MTDVKLSANGNVKFWWVPLGGFSNPLSPAITEINAGTDLSDAISWNDLDFGIQSSDVKADPAVSAKGKVNVRGASKYGGKISFYFPGTFGDASNLYASVFTLLRLPGTQGYLVERVDGNISLTAGGAYPLAPAVAATTGDLVHTFSVQSDGWADAIVGEDAFRYTITFQPLGSLGVYEPAKATTAAPAVAILPLTASGTHAVASKFVVAATVVGRDYTRGVNWTSSDVTKATVSNNGVVSVLSTSTAGTVNISCTYPETGTAATAPCVLTLS